MDPTTDDIFGKSIITANVISDRFRETIAEAAEESYRRQIRRARRRSSLFRPMVRAIRRAGATLASHYIATEVISYLGGVLAVARQMPDWLQEVVGDTNPRSYQWNDQQPFPEPPREPISQQRPPVIPPQSRRMMPPDEPPREPPLIPGPFGDEAPEGLRFPIIEEGARRLLETNVLPRDQFDEASEAAKQRAFTMTTDVELDVIQRVRDTLAENIDKGTSLNGFRKDLDDELRRSFIGPAHLETVYRTNVQSAFRDGRQTLLSNAIVAAAFPYQSYIPIQDDRVRDSHARLESLGLDGTNIYRLDDPFWDYFTPPIHYNCRCATNLLTLDAAAEAGVKEAREWLASGRPPQEPQIIYSPGNFPIEPIPGWGSRGRVGVVAQ
jgi:SPP1 gp7 family putative phage head morphogenesis protein